MRVRTHTNPFNFYTRMTPISFDEVFGESVDSIDLEVGFGRGIFLRRYAALHPDRKVVGVEIRKAIVDILDQRVQEEGLKNVHLVHGSGSLFLEDCVPDHFLDRVFVFHPDPWFKKRHHKRRVVNTSFLDLLSKKMKPEGMLYISTDVTPLWEAMSECLEAHSAFSEEKDSHFWEHEYLTHWSEFSKETLRSFNYGAFKRA